jgi:hypothetical protein
MRPKTRKAGSAKKPTLRDLIARQQSVPEKYRYRRPGVNALRAARELDAPLDPPKDRAKATRIVVAQLAFRFTAWRRGE